MQGFQQVFLLQAGGNLGSPPFLNNDFYVCFSWFHPKFEVPLFLGPSSFTHFVPPCSHLDILLPSFIQIPPLQGNKVPPYNLPFHNLATDAGTFNTPFLRANQLVQDSPAGSGSRRPEGIFWGSSPW